MRIALLSAYLLIVLAACGGASAASLDGTWVIDGDWLQKKLKDESPEERQMAQMMLGMFELKFADGKVTMGNETHAYKVTKTSGNEMTLELTEGPSKGDAVTVTLDGDRLVFSDGPDGEPMTLRRKK